MRLFLDVSDLQEASDGYCEWEIVGVTEGKIFSVEEHKAIIVEHPRHTLLFPKDVGKFPVC